MRTLNLKLIIVCLLTAAVSAQQRVDKSKQSISVNKDVVIDLNTNYVEIEVDTWNKNTVEVEAYLESEELSAEALKNAAKQWDLDIDASLDRVSINSSNANAAIIFNSNSQDYSVYLQELEERLANMPKVPAIPAIPEMPNMPEMPQFPELPELPKGLNKIEFDYDSYKKDGEAYLNKWSEKYEKEYGEDFKKQMEDWAKKFAESDYKNKMEAWGEAFAKQFEGKWSEDMEKWGEQFGESFGKDWASQMEKWGEEFGKNFGKQAEAWARQFERQMEREAREIERQAMGLERQAMREQERAEAEKLRAQAREQERAARTMYFGKRTESKVKKVIKIKIPKGAKLKVNVRHGELSFASVVHNLNADVAYAAFKAVEVDGGSTSINVSYAPVDIDHWKLGELHLNYVDDAQIHKAERIILSANSSNIGLGTLTGSAVIDGSFGDLNILNIDEAFSNLNVIIENSDARIALPETVHSLQFKGNRSRLNHPNNSQVTAASFSTGDLSSGKTIVINAKYSSVTMQ
jgi:hypothetical protein